MPWSSTLSIKRLGVGQCPQRRTRQDPRGVRRRLAVVRPCLPTLAGGPLPTTTCRALTDLAGTDGRRVDPHPAAAAVAVGFRRLTVGPLGGATPQRRAHGGLHLGVGERVIPQRAGPPSRRDHLGDDLILGQRAGVDKPGQLEDSLIEGVVAPAGGRGELFDLALQRAQGVLAVTRPVAGGLPVRAGPWSPTVGTPRILVPPPCGFGISTARTGGGK